MGRRAAALVVFLVFAALLCLHTTAAEPPETQQQDGAKKVFVPTHEWQTIEEGQAIPAGLHVRMDLQTGKKEAKLMEPEDKKPSKLQGLTIIDTPRPPKNRETTKESTNDPDTEHDSSELDFTTDSGTKIRFVDPKDAPQMEKKKEWSQEDTMKMTLLSTGLLTGTIESRLEVLKSLEDEVHDIEQAEIFMGVGGVEALVALANHTSEPLASMAALVLGSTVQSHPKLQSKAVESNAVPVLVDLLQRRLDAGASEQTCNRALYALSALLRRTPVAQRKFETLEGPALLVKVFESLQETSKNRIKVLLFVADLFSEDIEDKVMEFGEPASQKNHGALLALHCLGSTNSQAHSNLEQKDVESSSNIQAQCTEVTIMASGHWLGLETNGWCRAAVRQAQRVLSVDDAQKALEVLDALAPGCVDVFGADPAIMETLGKLAEGWVEDAKTETDEQWKSLLEGLVLRAHALIKLSRSRRDGTCDSDTCA